MKKLTKTKSKKKNKQAAVVGQRNGKGKFSITCNWDVVYTTVQVLHSKGYYGYTKHVRM